jgi:hypothetical protein
MDLRLQSEVVLFLWPAVKDGFAIVMVTVASLVMMAVDFGWEERGSEPQCEHLKIEGPRPCFLKESNQNLARFIARSEIEQTKRLWIGVFKVGE